MNNIKEKLIKYTCVALAYASIIFLAGIMAVLLLESIPAIKGINFFGFVTGTGWYPTQNPPEYGIFPLIAGSAAVSVLASLICVPLGIGTALYLYEIAGDLQKKILKPLIEILAGVPSIIFGFFGIVVVAPFLQRVFGLPTGLCLMTAGVVLGFMAVPNVASMAEDALGFVPRSFREASYALGADRWQTLVKVVVPAAGSGIATAIILGVSRLMGETMIVLMVAGGAAVVPDSPFSPVRPMTAAIAAEMGEAARGSLHYSSLFFIGLLLFIITLSLNMLSEKISWRYRMKLGRGR